MYNNTTVTESPVRRRPLMVFALLAAAGLGALVWWQLPPARTVRVQEAGVPVVTARVRARTVAEALQQAGVQVQPADRVAPALATSLPANALITLRRAVPVGVTADGMTLAVTTAAERVQEVLAQAGVRVSALDRVLPALDAPVSAGMAIAVVRRNLQWTTVEEEIPFADERHADYDMVEGDTRTVQEGESGSKRITLRRLLEEGRVIEQETVREDVLRPAVPRVVAYGALGIISRGGRDYRYVRALDITATAYNEADGMTPGVMTYTGMRVRRGVVAVDPQVIPLGTRLYVEGYGPAIAADTGGAIKGSRIDLYMESLTEARAFGVRPVRVYILRDEE